MHLDIRFSEYVCPYILAQTLEEDEVAIHNHQTDVLLYVWTNVCAGDLQG